MTFVRTVLFLAICFWLWQCPGAIASADSADALRAGAAAFATGDYARALDRFTQR
ncbi:MAG: hypothetical protein WBB01_10845 [Phormidesmis sp.]